MNFRNIAIFSVITLTLLGSYYLLVPGSGTQLLATQTQANSPGSAKNKHQHQLNNQPVSQAIGTHHDITHNINDEITHNKENNDFSERRLAELIEKHVSLKMRREINAKLNPPGQTYREVETAQGGYVDMGNRASSVMIAIIDDDGSTVVTDINLPLPISSIPEASSSNTSRPDDSSPDASQAKQ